jgi:hypothetical protein
MQVHQTEEERSKKKAEREKGNQKERRRNMFTSQATSQTKASTPEVSSG